jgi:hypothetical protein
VKSVTNHLAVNEAGEESAGRGASGR